MKCPIIVAYIISVTKCYSHTSQYGRPFKHAVAVNYKTYENNHHGGGKKSDLSEIYFLPHSLAERLLEEEHDSGGSHDGESVHDSHDGDEHDSYDEEVAHDSHDGDGYDSHDEKFTHDSHDEEFTHDSHDEESDHDNHDHDSHDENVNSISDGDSGREKPWMIVILMTLLINCASLIGVIFLGASLLKRISGIGGEDIESQEVDLNKKNIFVDVVIPSFSSGTLLATSFFLILPEAITLITTENENDTEDGHDGHDHENHEGESNLWLFGAAVLLGYLIPMCLPFFVCGKLCTHSEKEEVNLEANQTKENKDGVIMHDEGIETHDRVDAAVAVCLPQNAASNKRNIDYVLCMSILLGDGLHNFADGVFVGTAFLLCSNKVAYSIAFVTVLHELPQEVADFFILTRHAGLNICSALILNFLSGLTVLFGGLLVLSFQLGSLSIGLILAIAGGVYIYIATTEVSPRVNTAIKTKKHRIFAISGFVVGTILIGLVLLDHQHCDTA